MKRLYNITLVRGLTFFLILFATLLLAAIGILSIVSGQQALNENTWAGLQAIAIEKEVALTAWMEQQVLNIHLISQSAGLQSALTLYLAAEADSPAQTMAANQVLHSFEPWVEHGRFTELMLLHPTSGQVLLAIDPTEIGKFKENQVFFLHGQQGANIQPPQYVVQLQETVIYSSAPIHDASGQLLAVLVGRLPVSDLNHLVQQKDSIYHTLDAYLVNQTQLLITQPLLLEDPAILQRTIQTESVTQCLREQNGALQTINYREEKVLTVYRWLPQNEMCLIVEVDQVEALSPLSKFRNIMVVLSLLALILSSLLANWLAATISHPLRTMQQAAAQFGQGQLSIRLPLPPTRELGLLAQEFNKMAARLEESVHTLEDRVAERTAELSKMNARLQTEIAERAHTEAGLRESESRFRQLFHAVPVPLVLTSIEDGTILKANEHFAQLMRAERDSLLGQNIARFYYDPDERPQRMEFFRSNDTAVNHELHCRRADGTSAWVLLYTTRITYQSQQTLLSTMHDLTERRQVEDALRASEEKFRALVQNASDIITIVDENGAILYDSPSVERILGYSPEERLGQSAFDYIVADDMAELIKLFTHVATHPGSILQHDMPVLHKDGSCRYVEAVGSNLLNNPAVNGIVVNIHDVTERKQMEDLLRRERDLFDRLLQTSPTGIAIVNAHGQITYANVRAEKILGLSKGSIEQRVYNDPQWRITDFDGNPFPQEKLPFALAKTTGQTVYDVRHAIAWPAETSVFLSINASPLINGQGEFDGIIATFTDITAQEKAQKQLAQQSQELTRSNAELQQFAYVASHDLQEPLRMITSFLKLLTED